MHYLIVTEAKTYPPFIDLLKSLSVNSFFEFIDISDYVIGRYNPPDIIFWFIQNQLPDKSLEPKAIHITVAKEPFSLSVIAEALKVRKKNGLKTLTIQKKVDKP